MNNIGEKIKTERKKRGLSQRNLANRINIAHTTIARIEKGETKPDATSTVALADFFNVSCDYILGRKEKNYNVSNNSSSPFTSPYKETPVFKDIIKIIDSLTVNELHMVLGVMKAVLTEEAVEKIIDKVK